MHQFGGGVREPTSASNRSQQCLYGEKKKRDLRVLFEKEINGRRRPKSEYIFRGKSLRV